VEESGEESEDLPLPFRGDADGAERLLRRRKFLSIVDALDCPRSGAALVEVVKGGNIVEAERASI
jgi:hypothetical protein